MRETQRYELLNHLIDTYSFVNYLEIGVFSEAPNGFLDIVQSSQTKNRFCHGLHL